MSKAKAQRTARPSCGGFLTPRSPARLRWWPREPGSAMTTQQPPVKKPKQPLDYILRQMHDAMEMVFAYDHDPNFVPSADELVLLEMIQKQFAGYSAMAHIIVATLRQRAKEAGEVQHAGTSPP
jgi:hypothetical protein